MTGMTVLLLCGDIIIRRKKKESSATLYAHNRIDPDNGGWAKRDTEIYNKLVRLGNF